MRRRKLKPGHLERGLLEYLAAPDPDLDRYVMAAKLRTTPGSISSTVNRLEHEKKIFVVRGSLGRRGRPGMIAARLRNGT